MSSTKLVGSVLKRIMCSTGLENEKGAYNRERVCVGGDKLKGEAMA